MAKDSIDNTPIGNQVWYPIYKPWAAVMMSIVSDEGEGTWEEVSTFMRTQFKKHYRRKNQECYYYKIIKVKTSFDLDLIGGKLSAYGRIVSPFRVEAYETHGSR